MTYEEITAGFRALQASDFDYKNINARGWERLAELTDALMTVPDAEKAIPEMFSVMERLPDADLGSPGPLVHTMECWRGGYEDELVNSVRRCPSMLSLWMVNRILNTNLPDDIRRSYMALLNEAATHRNAPETVCEDARGFVEFQMRKPNQLLTGVISPFHSSSRKKAKEKRTLVIWPVFDKVVESRIHLCAT